MTTSHAHDDVPAIPPWHVGDRMNKALLVSGVGVGKMAGMLGVDNSTVTRWTRGHIVPKRAALIAWGAITNVPVHWLETGCELHHASEKDLRACRDSNPKPSDWEPRVIVGGLASVNPRLTANRRIAASGHILRAVAL